MVVTADTAVFSLEVMWYFGVTQNLLYGCGSFKFFLFTDNLYWWQQLYGKVWIYIDVFKFMASSFVQSLLLWWLLLLSN